MKQIYNNYRVMVQINKQTYKRIVDEASKNDCSLSEVVRTALNVFFLENDEFLKKNTKF